MNPNPYGSLLERLGGCLSSRAHMTHEACVLASVSAHLARMLSTRAGSVQALPEYGLPDLNDMRLSRHDAMSHGRDSIRRFIETYEPRLSRIRVVALPGHGVTLGFLIEGVLEVAGVRREVTFIADIEGSGKVRVR